jgi:type IV secretory pathway VirB3-like protein
MPVPEDIFKGATRPPTLAGVPMVPLVILLGLSFLLIVWGVTLLSGWVAWPIGFGTGTAVIWMRIVTKQDDQRLRQMFLRFKLTVPQKNRRFWRSRCYSPVAWRGSSEAARR